ncbi:formyl transferase [Candidatus Woesearchaeota archaeon]|nr:formyl transferase [Candidatus Woesearchaeota archaeon]
MIKIRAIFLGKNKPYVIKSLTHLIETGFTVTIVVCESNVNHKNCDLCKKANELGIIHCSDNELYSIISKQDSKNQKLIKNIDVVISYLFWKKIKKSLITLPKIGCINFHPAPLPDFRGFSPYTFGILQNSSFWGVSAHFVDEEFDTGNLIKTSKFLINPKNETSFSLEQKSQKRLYFLFKEIVEILFNSKKLESIPQSNGQYFSKKDFEENREIVLEDSNEDIDKKIRAYWYPPFEGAYIKIKEKKLFIINKRILELLK